MSSQPATNLSDLRRGTAMAAPKKSMADILKLPKPKQLPAMLDAFQTEIKRALPSHLNADRISRIALTAFRRTPKLGQCDPASVFACIIQSAQLGLEIDTLGRAYLVPYKQECQFIPGWKGLVELVHRAGQASAWTGAAFQGDYFDYALGDSPFVKHKPCGESDPQKMTHVYAIGRPKGAEWPIIEVWPVARVSRHRDRYNKVGSSHYSHGNWEMYARKVVLLQVLKYLPMSPELERAIAMNDDAEVGAQKFSVDDALEGEYMPVTAEGETGEQGSGDAAADESGASETAATSEKTEDRKAQSPAPTPTPAAADGEKAYPPSTRRKPQSLDLE